MRSPALWLAGATAASVVAATTAAAAGPLGHQRLAAAPPTVAPGASQPPGASLASSPDLGRRRGNPGPAPAPVAKVALTEASNGQAIVVKPGTEIDVTLKPDSGQRWSPPRSDHPQSVSRGGGWGWSWGGQGRPHDGTDLGPGHMGDGSTHAVFFAHRPGQARLSSAEHKPGGLLLLMPPSTSRSWGVTVTVSGPAPAAPKPAAPAVVEPATPAAPSATTVDARRLVTPVAPAVQRLPVTLPRL